MDVNIFARSARLNFDAEECGTVEFSCVCVCSYAICGSFAGREFRVLFLRTEKNGYDNEPPPRPRDKGGCAIARKRPLLRLSGANFGLPPRAMNARPETGTAKVFFFLTFSANFQNFLPKRLEKGFGAQNICITDFLFAHCSVIIYCFRFVFVSHYLHKFESDKSEAGSMSRRFSGERMRACIVSACLRAAAAASPPVRPRAD